MGGQSTLSVHLQDVNNYLVYPLLAKGLFDDTDSTHGMPNQLFRKFH